MDCSVKNTIFPQDQTFWYLKREDVQPLRTNKTVDVVVIGGGMAGLTAAQAFAKKGQAVVLLEAYYCGSGASGKSSGFITPNGEISLSGFIKRYGQEGGKRIWDAIEKDGVEHIRRNILEHKLDCDYSEEDSLFVANSEKDVQEVIKEAESLGHCGYSKNYIKKEDLSAFLGSNGYYGAVIYPKSFGISAYKYCQGMKNVLSKAGVEIYEETPALQIDDGVVTTLHASVKAKHIIVCTDRFIPELGKLTQQIYHAQTFLMVSQALEEDQIKAIFPQRKLMVWDTALIYSYFRFTGNRLLVGGGSVLNTYNKQATYHSNYMYRKLTRYIEDKFPNHQLQFEQMWPGLIGLSKDVAPIAGSDKVAKSIYYIGAAAGLPVAAMLANYAADHLIDGSDNLRDYFSPYRHFPISGFAQKVLGSKVSFAVSNWLSQETI